MAENHRVSRRADDGQRHHERARRTAAGDHRAAILGLHGLRTPRGFLVDPSSAILPRDVRASGETTVKKSRLVHVEDEPEVEPLQLLPNLCDPLLVLPLIHVASFPVQVDVCLLYTSDAADE